MTGKRLSFCIFTSLILLNGISLSLKVAVIGAIGKILCLQEVRNVKENLEGKRVVLFGKKIQLECAGTDPDRTGDLQIYDEVDFSLTRSQLRYSPWMSYLLIYFGLGGWVCMRES